MAGRSPAKKKPTRGRAAAAAAEKARERQSDTPTSLSPTAEALKALKNLSSPAGTNKATHATNQVASNHLSLDPAMHGVTNLRIQAPVIRSSSTGSGNAGISGLASDSPGDSGLSAPTSPADDGLDTPDTRDSGLYKRPRHLDPLPAFSAPRTPTAGPPTPTSSTSSTSSTSPLFLEKTYEMLDKCSPQIACWSHAGDSFIVKNPVAFAEHVIPIYFKHKNFSSFVRQLNFYGFRKVRVVDPDVTGAIDPKDWWEFRHDKFLRGHKTLLKEIKRRSLPSNSSSTSASGNSGSTATDAVEIDELRTEVATLREQIQTLNKHMFSVMQIMMTRNSATPPTPTGPTGPPSSLPFPPPHLHHAQAFQPHAQAPHGLPMYAYGSGGGLPPAHPAAAMASAAAAAEGRARGAAAAASTVASPGSMYALRPIQSYAGVPPGYPYPVTPSGDPSVDWDLYSRHAFQAAHAAHVAHAAQAHAAAVAAMAQPSTPSRSGSTPGSNSGAGPTSTADSTATSPAVSSSVHAATGLKRTRSQQQKRSPSAGSSSTPSPATATSTGTSTSSSAATLQPVGNPEAAVRQLSIQVTQIRSDLLQSILVRTLAFIRTQPSSTSTPSGSSSNTTLANPEIDAIAKSIADDIQHRMGQIDDAEAATHGRPRGSGSNSGSGAASSETSHMYRVEMLKFVSKELPRAMSEAVEKRLPAPTKKTLNRSLLALMVQKAQGALEAQMRTETAAASSASTSTK